MTLNFPVVSRSHSSFQASASSSKQSVNHSATSKRPPALSFSSTQQPSDDQRVFGLYFNVNFDHIYLRNHKVRPHRVGYAVTYKSQLLGRRVTSGIWKHGVKLLYEDEQGTKTLWLCRACHLNRRINDAYTVNGTCRVSTRLESFHRILLPITLTIKLVTHGKPQYLGPPSTPHKHVKIGRAHV